MYIRITRGRYDPSRSADARAVAPDVIAAVRRIPGCQDVIAGMDDAAGQLVTIATFDTAEHVNFSREALGEVVTRVGAAGIQLDPPEVYAAVE